MHQVLPLLASACFNLGPHRQFRLNALETCWLLEAEHRGWVLDISFVHRFAAIGQFSIDSLYLEYPGFAVIDEFNGLEALRAGQLILRRSLSEENGLLLLNRVMAFAAKYSMRFGLSSINGDFALELRDHLATSAQSAASYGGHDMAGFISTFFRALRRSPRPHELLEDLLETNLFSTACPLLADIIRARSSALLEDVSGIESTGRLVAWLTAGADRREMRRLAKVLAPLRIRPWNRSDQELLREVESLAT